MMTDVSLSITNPVIIVNPVLMEVKKNAHVLNKLN